ncbi:hypothetical protein G6F22_008093 [Rhizopus arrhizus]|nr:hypothetical protein G6F22_008093 [Rhizopus arrhizus]
MDSLKYYGCNPEDIYFQQDKDPKHTSKLAKQWFADNNFKSDHIFSWPAQSPDFNPIEHSTHCISLPITANGNTSALVIIDGFSAWIECYPTSSQNATFTCLCLFQWICQYGLPHQVYCDNGTHLTAEEVKVMMLISYGIEIKYGVPYHPQGQGKVERVNGILKTLLKKYAQIYMEEWDNLLPAALYVMRTTLRRDHSYSPFFLVYGRHPRIMEEFPHHELDITTDAEDILLERIKEIITLNDTIIPLAIQNKKVYKEKMVKQYNRNTVKKRFAVHDQVMVENLVPQGQCAALLNKWYGPYHIKECVGKDVYRIREGDLVFPAVYHANQLKPLRDQNQVGGSVAQPIRPVLVLQCCPNDVEYCQKRVPKLSNKYPMK